MYFPHKEGAKENYSTTKLVKGNPSLDIFYYNGPCLLMKLYDLLVAFRAKPIALKGDRKGIFLQIVVRENHRDLLHCLLGPFRIDM